MTRRQWIISGAAALAAVIASIIYFRELPDMMAIHFSLTDKPDRYVHKGVGAFLLPVIILLLPALSRLNMKLEQDPAKRNRFGDVSETINIVMILLLLAIHVVLLAYNLGYDIIRHSRFAPLAVGLVLIAIGNVLPRAPQSALKLYRMTDEQYTRYTRFNGRFMVIAGFLLLLSALLPGQGAVYFVFAVIAALTVTAVGSSFYFSRK